MPVKVQLGSGNNYKEGYLNLDISGKYDEYVNLEEGLGNIEDDSVDEILAENLFPMIQNTKYLLNSCHQKLKFGGKLIILSFDAGKYPELFFQDPEHEKGFTSVAYEYFCKGYPCYESFGSVYGYKPWNLNSIKEEGKCLRVIMTPEKL